MARNGQGVALRQVRTLFETGAVGTLTDRQLLERFRAGNDEAAGLAFTALVERHGPMVFRVCRRALGDEHAAHDAFQATFLVLVRKAGSLHARGSLGPWLLAVALRVAAFTRSSEARRRAHERRAAETQASSHNPAGFDDLGLVIHEEIDRLPERFRAAVVLCDLEGLTQEQAAHQLGWPAGTVRSRLARGRRRLQERLTRRGLAPAAGGLAVALAAEAAEAAVPATLARAATRTASLVTAGQAAPGVVATSAAALTNGVLKVMFLTKLKVAVSAFLAVGLAATAGATAVFALPEGAGPRDDVRTVEPSRSATGRTSGEMPEDDANRNRNPSAPAVAAPHEETVSDLQELKRAEGQLAIDRALLDVKRAEDKLAWAQNMYGKGYVSRAVVASAEQALQRAKFQLGQVRIKQNAFEKYATIKAVKEAKSELEKAEADFEKAKADQMVALKTLIDAMQEETRHESPREPKGQAAKSLNERPEAKPVGPLSQELSRSFGATHDSPRPAPERADAAEERGQRPVQVRPQDEPSGQAGPPEEPPVAELTTSDLGLLKMILEVKQAELRNEETRLERARATAAVATELEAICRKEVAKAKSVAESAALNSRLKRAELKTIRQLLGEKTP